MFEKIRKFNKGLVCFSVLFCFGLLMLPLATRAKSASLFLSPSTGTYSVGSTFSIAVKVNSGGQAINAGDAILIFNPSKLEVRNISKAGSIFTLWVQDPIFSNSAGTISLAGGKQSPGYNGSSATIITITFKAITSGTASVSFSSGSVLADDGKGTNVLANLISGSYTLTTRKIETLPPDEEYIPPSLPGQVPAAPIIYSLTHPEEDNWYSNNNPEFRWQLLPDITGVSLLLHKKATASPGSISDGLMESKKYKGVGDGVWHFHIKFENQYGWSRITHRKVLIDTVPPNPFEIKVQRENLTDPQPILLFSTTDDLSGTEYYEVKVGEGDSFPVVEENIETNPYKLSLQAPGRYPIIVKAFDKAGNFTPSSVEIEVWPIETPKILKIPKRIGLGEILEIEGVALPEATVRIFIRKTGQASVLSETKANSQGVWELLYERVLQKGKYEIWAQAQDRRGALSYPTEIHFLQVGLPPILKFGKIAVDYMSLITTLIILIIGVISIIFYAWYRISIWRRRIKRETKEAALSVVKAFAALRRKVQREIEYLNKRAGLTRREKEVRDNLREALDVSKKVISKEIEDIERELE